MNTFKKFVLSGMNGLAVEAVLQFSKVNETLEADNGEYVTYVQVLNHFQGVQEDADRLIARRRAEPNGTWVTPKKMGLTIPSTHC